jgi:ribosomal protein L10
MVSLSNYDILAKLQTKQEMVNIIIGVLKVMLTMELQQILKNVGKSVGLGIQFTLQKSLLDHKY